MCALGRPLNELAQEVIQQALDAIDASTIVEKFEVRENFDRDVAVVTFLLTEGKALEQKFSFEEPTNATTDPTDLENRLRRLLFPSPSSAI